MNDCVNAKYGVELCGTYTVRYSVLTKDGDAKILCPNCLGRWATFGSTVVAYDRVVDMSVEDFR